MITEAQISDLLHRLEGVAQFGQPAGSVNKVAMDRLLNREAIGMIEDMAYAMREAGLL